MLSDLAPEDPILRPFTLGFKRENTETSLWTTLAPGPAVGVLFPVWSAFFLRAGGRRPLGDGGWR